MNIEIKYFELDNGKQPFKEWLDDLDKVTKSILLKRLDRVTLGNFGDCKPLINTDSLWELKIDYGPGYRIYFGRKGNKIIILLVGGEKKSQNRYIAKAEEYWEIVKEKIYRGKT